MIEVLMSRLSDLNVDGIIVSWAIEAGQMLPTGDELIEFETDKATMTFDADESGLVHHVAREGDSLPVGAPLAQMLDSGGGPTNGKATESSPSKSVVEEDVGEAEGHPLSGNDPPPAPSLTGTRRRICQPYGSGSPPANRITDDTGIAALGAIEPKPAVRDGRISRRA